jgi:hypothetical protein
MQKTTITGLFLMLFGILAQGQTTQVTPFFRQQFFSDTGAIAAGYKLCAYQAGTSTPLNTYTDQGGGTPNANPVILDSTGSGNIWLLNRAYKLVLRQPGTDNTCSTGTIVKTVDNVAPFYRYSGTAAPVSGTYQTGDFVWNSAPVSTIGSASAVLGWTCTAGGTPGTWVAVGPTPIGNLPSASVTGAFTPYTTANYIASETGSNNAIAGALADIGGNNVTLAAGLCVTVKLGHTLQAGADTFVLNGTSKNIKSHFNAANNIGTAYAATGFWSGCYDGTEWLDQSE